MARLTEAFISNMQPKELEKVFGTKQRSNRTQNKEKESRQIKKKYNAENSRKEHAENLRNLLIHVFLMYELKASQFPPSQKIKYAIVDLKNDFHVYCKVGRKEFRVSYSAISRLSGKLPDYPFDFLPFVFY